MLFLFEFIKLLQEDAPRNNEILIIIISWENILLLKKYNFTTSLKINSWMKNETVC